MIEQRTQRSQRCVVLLRKRACWILCLQISSVTTSPVYIVPVITRITNASLGEGVMPKSLKHAIVRPLLKKPSLDKDTLSSYRPVNNLSQLSKIIEKVVARRIMTHVSDRRMVECFQSAYRKNYSTETALLYVTSAVKTAMDKNKESSCFSLISVPPSVRSTITS